MNAIEVRVAFIQTQTALMLAEMEHMKAANQECLLVGKPIAYGDEQWADFRAAWNNILGHNALISFLQGD